MSESLPVQPSPVSTTESVPNRQPQPLSRNFEQRVKQLEVMTANPTDQQVGKLADKITADHPEDADKATEMAVNSFNNMRNLIKERTDADATVKQARKDALSAPSSEFKVRVALLREAEQRRNEATSTLRTFGNDFQEAGVELDPSQTPLSLGEKWARKRMKQKPTWQPEQAEFKAELKKE